MRWLWVEPNVNAFDVSLAKSPDLHPLALVASGPLNSHLFISERPFMRGSQLSSDSRRWPPEVRNHWAKRSVFWMGPLFSVLSPWPRRAVPKEYFAFVYADCCVTPGWWEIILVSAWLPPLLATPPPAAAVSGRRGSWKMALGGGASAVAAGAPRLLSCLEERRAGGTLGVWGGLAGHWC